MNRTLRSLCLLALAPAATLGAQTFSTLPVEYERAWGRASLGLFSAAQGRYQVAYASPFAPGTTITGIGIRRAPLTEDRPGFTVDLEIRASSGPNAPGGLSGTFANNVGSDELVVLPQQTITIPAMPANRGPGEFASIPFQVPFVFGTNGNSNLVFEIRVFGISSFLSWETDAVQAATQGRAVNVGTQCGFGKIWSGSGSGIYVGGSTLSLRLIDASANSVALLIPALDLKEFVPGVLLPFSMTAIGAGPGCDLMVNPELGALALPTSAMGVANATVPIPSWFGQAGLGFQWAYLVPPTATNPLGLELTNVRAVFIGPEVCEPVVGQVQAVGSPSLPSGLANTGSAPILQITTQ